MKGLRPGAIVLVLTASIGARAGRAVGARDGLLSCNDWLYLINPSGCSLADMAASGFDGVVTDYSRDGGEAGEWMPAEVGALRAAGMLSLAYMSIGEAEEYRFYWRPEWAYAPPSWLGPENPEWEGNYKVRYWDPGWQRILYGNPSGTDRSYLDRILGQGFDGVYLDIVDAYSYWSDENAELPRAEARLRMIDLVASMADYAREAGGRPDFLVLPQNAEEIVIDDRGTLDADGERYLTACDGIGAEDVWYDGTNAQPAAETACRVALLDAFRTHNGARAVFSAEYVLDASAPDGRRNRDRYNNFHREARARGYLSYAALIDRALDAIVSVPRGGGFDYAQPEPGPGDAGSAAIELNGSSFRPGDRFAAVFRLDRTIGRPFTAFAVFVLPHGSMRDARTLGPLIDPVEENAPGLAAPFRAGILDAVVPEGAPAGACEIVAAFFDPERPIAGRADAFLEAAGRFDIR